MTNIGYARARSMDQNTDRQACGVVQGEAHALAQARASTAAGRPSSRRNRWRRLSDG